MMVPMTKDMQEFFDKLLDAEKIRFFYELTKYISENAEESDDDQMNCLLSDIANVLNDINNL